MLHCGSRRAALGNGSVRKFIVPTLNYDADHYSEIADLNHEPIFTTDTASDKIIFYQQKKMAVKIYPNHSQSVERAIKLVSNAAYKVCGFDRIDGFIRAGIASRNMIPSANTQTDYIQAHL